MPRGDLFSTLAKIVGLGGPEAASQFQQLLRHQEKRKFLIFEADIVKLPHHRAVVSGPLAILKDKVEQSFQSHGLTPPGLMDLANQCQVEKDQIQEVMELLRAEGTLVRAKEGIYFHSEALNSLRLGLVSWLEEKGRITTLEFKAMAGVSRKYMIPLLEYFDAAKVTLRVGEDRILRQDSSS